MGREKKTSKGKQKIEIKKIEALEARQVCFSKRKFGIFSKANELSTLCGAKIAVLIESPAGHPFSFGSPSVEHVANLFLKGGSGSTETDAQEAQRLSGVQQLNNSLMEVGSKIDSAKLKKAVLMSRITDLSAKYEDVRRMEDVENLNLGELEKITESLERFKENIKTKMLKDMVTGSGNTISTRHNLSGNGIGGAPSSANPLSTKLKTNGEGPCDLKVSAAAMTVFPESRLRVDNAGSSHGTGKAITVLPEPGLRVDNAGSSHGTGNVSAAAMTKLPEPGLRVDNTGSNHGTGKVSAAAMTMFPQPGLRVDNAGSSYVSAAAMTMLPDPGLRVDNTGSNHGTGKVSAAAMTMFPRHGLRVDNAGSSYGTGKVSAAAMTMLPEPGLRVDNTGSNRGTGKVSDAAMTMFPQPGLRVDNAGSSYGTGKGVDIDMNLSIYEDETFDHNEQMNPFFDLNANVAGPSQPRRAHDDNKVSCAPLFDLNLLGGYGNFALKEDPK